jgi:hypothetical protein
MRVDSGELVHADNAAAQSSPTKRVQGCVFMGTAPGVYQKGNRNVKKF